MRIHIKKIRLLNSPLFNPQAILDFNSKMVQDHIAALSEMRIWPSIVLEDIELEETNHDE